MLQNLKKSSNIVTIVGKKGNLAILTVIVMAAFETKNVHSAMDGWSWANSLEQSDFNENKHMRRKQ